MQAVMFDLLSGGGLSRLLTRESTKGITRWKADIVYKGLGVTVMTMYAYLVSR